MKKTIVALTAAVVLCFGLTAAAGEYLTGIQWDEPKIVDPGGPGKAPSDAIVLFDGTDMSKWNNGENWSVKDGIAYSGKGQVRTKEEFGDCQVHLEFASPSEVKGSGQGRGNSGVFLMGKYEVQVLDSFDNKTYYDGQCAAIYKQHPPLVNACRGPGEWQSYDIIWRGPKFDDEGKLVSPAFITVLQNGIVVQNHFELLGDTPYNRPPAYKAHGEKGPIALQDHGNPVRFRNIWVRELKEVPSKRIHEPKTR